jgi:hypothetical protein
MDKNLTAAGRQAPLGESGLIAGEDGVLAVVTAILRDEEANVRDRLKAAELLGKHFGIFNEKLDAAGDNDFSETLLAARGRAKDAK